MTPSHVVSGLVALNATGIRAVKSSRLKMSRALGHICSGLLLGG